ncbi:MAG: hypothetical protein CO093_11010 [Alphaproteobacteria bacterium CG_4_9_14_3_um_filter_47_13]|nr:MAG: hypothetical protein CO093_11010 [Alphaproteobacteria bacterium CG_4_9_14_3_um_filter_47_13]
MNTVVAMKNKNENITTAISEEEIRPDDLFNAFMDLSAKDAENFFDKSKFIEVPCPGCGKAENENHFLKHSFRYNHCSECGSIYASPRPDSAALLSYYATSESQRFWAEAVLAKTGQKRKESIMMPNISRVEDVLAKRGRRPKRILDVGSANGAFLTEWKKRHPEAELFGIEPGQESAQTCRDLGIKVFENFVEDEAEKGQAQGDLVTCFEVIEHVQDPERFARAMHNITAPGGVAIMSCLGADGFDIQVLWEKSRSIVPPYHLNFLSKRGMEAMFSKAGFSKIEIYSPGRLDVEIVQKSMERGVIPGLSRFEDLLLSRGKETLQAFQEFLAGHCLSSHVWIICHKD